MGIPDHESWWWNSYAPTGHATGWRRWGMLAFLALLLLAAVGGFVALIVRAAVSLFS